MLLASCSINMGSRSCKKSDSCSVKKKQEMSCCTKKKDCKDKKSCDVKKKDCKDKKSCKVKKEAKKK